MKCPRCDADLTEQRKCGKCGMNVDGSRKELEVEYKDFKISELLEIRQKRHTGLSRRETTKVEEQPLGNAFDTKGTAKSLSDNKKNFFSVFVIAVLVIMLITGVFFLFRYFMTQ